jgi:hypothetical protein
LNSFLPTCRADFHLTDVLKANGIAPSSPKRTNRDLKRAHESDDEVKQFAVEVCRVASCIRGSLIFSAQKHRPRPSKDKKVKREVKPKRETFTTAQSVIDLTLD